MKNREKVYNDLMDQDEQLSKAEIFALEKELYVDFTLEPIGYQCGPKISSRTTTASRCQTSVKNSQVSLG